MRVMVMIHATENSEAGALPSEALLSGMAEYNEALAQAGILLRGEGLKPSAQGKRMVISSRGRALAGGPFRSPPPVAAGSRIRKVGSMDEAVAWARRYPEPMPDEETTLEIRPIFEMENFGDETTPELQARDERLRVELEGKEQRDI